MDRRQLDKLWKKYDKLYEGLLNEDSFYRKMLLCGKKRNKDLLTPVTLHEALKAGNSLGEILRWRIMTFGQVHRELEKLEREVFLDELTVIPEPGKRDYLRRREQ